MLTPAPDPPPVSSDALAPHRWRDLLLAGLIISAGALLRFQHLDSGIPHAIGIDEPQIMERAVAMMKSGDFNPRFFDWPSLTIYLHLVTASATFLLGAMDGAWRNLNQVGPADMYLYLNGRALTAAFGAATVWLVYLIGCRWGRGHGLLAAGLATAATYNGLIVIVVPLAIAWLRHAPPLARTRRTLVMPLRTSVEFVRGLGRESTLDQAYDWMRTHTARGSKVVIESRALQLPGPDYEVVHVRSLLERTHDDYVADEVDYLLASSVGYGAAFAGVASREQYLAYQTLFTQADPLATFSPSTTTPGPELRILRIRR